MEIEYTKEGIIVNDGMLIKLADITKRVNIARIKEEKLVLLKFDWPEHRGFDGAHEHMVLPIDKANRLVNEMSGKQIYFGEIAGKHSEVYGDLDDDDVTIEEDADKVNNFLMSNPGGTDYNHSFTDAYACHLEEGDEDEEDEDGEKRLTYEEFYKLF